MTACALRAAARGIQAGLCVCVLAGLAGCASTARSAATTGPLQGTTTPPLAGQSAATMTPAEVALFARARARELELLASPLTAESAAEIAVLHHPAVDRALETLGLYDLDRLALTHEINPEFNHGRWPDTADTRIERSLTVDVMSWLVVPAFAPPTPPARAPLVQAANAIGTRLFTARRAWVSAVAGHELARYLEDVVAAAEVSRDIAARMRSAGNISELDALRAETLYAEAVARLTAAQATAAIERERLGQTLGLFGPDAETLQLPEHLPALPEIPIAADGLEARAVAERFDVEAGRLDGVAAEAGIKARSELRIAWLGYRGAYDLARHARDALVPLARSVSAEELKRYNGMLIGVQDLVANVGERMNAVTTALDASRNFWLAEIELERSMAGVGTPAGALPGAPGGYQPGTAYHVH